MKHPTNFMKIVFLFIEKLLAGRCIERKTARQTGINERKKNKGTRIGRSEWP